MATEYDLPDYDGLNILLVEDNKVNQLVAKALLSKANFNVSIANNGKEAVDLIQEQNYKLVLMDIQMPVMDGYQAVQFIRGLGGDYLNLPIIAMTAQDQASDRQECIDTGMNEYVSKPISPENLFQTISQFIKPKTTTINETVSIDDQQLPTNLSQIDLETALHRFVNNWDVLKRTMLSFANSHIDDVEKIKNALTEDDIETATRIAHSLKGSGGNIGATALSKISAEIESLFKKNILNEAIEKLPLLEKNLKQVCDELFSLDIASDEEQDANQNYKELTDESIDLLQADMKTVKESLMLDYGKCQSLSEEITRKLQGSQWAKTWSKAADAVNQFDFNSVGSLIDHLINDIRAQRS